MSFKKVESLSFIEQNSGFIKFVKIYIYKT